MSKFTKRILGAGKNIRNCLVVGSGLGMMDEIVDNFRTVFVVGDQTRKARNIVYREGFADLHLLTDIDFMFLDWDQHSNIGKIQPVHHKYHPTIFIGGTELWPMEGLRILQTQGYRMAESFKNMQKWTR